MTCGATKPIDGRAAPLVCNLPSGHEGPHGISLGHLPPYVTWRDA